MAKNSSIEWTHHTFNPWWGCTKISPACDNCYAETWAVRLGRRLWGSKTPRRFFSEAHWSEPIRWNREAKQLGQRRRVFCASMADVFENRRDLDIWRTKLWELIALTPWLDWLLLTKRINLVNRYVPCDNNWPQNVWLGTTVESQEWADIRIPILLQYTAVVRFISCEPLLGPINLQPWLKSLHWVIAGGESGPKSRPMNPSWVRDLRDQCLSESVPFHFKQWGNWRPESDLEIEHERRVIRLTEPSGEALPMVALGKKASGRDLDGKTWDEFPSLLIHC